jgi:hypothetical protein
LKEQSHSNIGSVKEEIAGAEGELGNIDKKDVFPKHRVFKINGYTNFNNKEDSYHDVGEYSWDF